MVRFFCAWLRRFFEIDEARLRVRVYLHEGLDLDAAEAHWSRGHRNPARTVPASRTERWPIRRIRLNKHEFGCVYVDYSCTTTHRRIMGSCRALLASGAIPG